MLIYWSIWTTRNDFIFKVVTPSLYRCRRKFKNKLALLIRKGKREYYSDIKDWVNIALYI
jgi:hypothetical protein